mmetsp:Transcript_50690/g.118439  ORF Transcript_50690/g.118439 Transcript_50690/m.118439 type:complete len:228 (+) Transcript_50690:410-1093(+)
MWMMSLNLRSSSCCMMMHLSRVWIALRRIAQVSRSHPDNTFLVAGSHIDLLHLHIGQFRGHGGDLHHAPTMAAWSIGFRTATHAGHPAGSTGGTDESHARACHRSKDARSTLQSMGPKCTRLKLEAALRRIRRQHALSRAAQVVLVSFLWKKCTMGTRGMSSLPRTCEGKPIPATVCQGTGCQTCSNARPAAFEVTLLTKLAYLASTASSTPRCSSANKDVARKWEI